MSNFPLTAPCFSPYLRRFSLKMKKLRGGARSISVESPFYVVCRILYQSLYRVVVFSRETHFIRVITYFIH